MHSKTPKENCSLRDKKGCRVEQIKGSTMSNQRGGMVLSAAREKIAPETISLCLREAYATVMYRRQKLLGNPDKSFLTSPNRR